MIAGGTPHLDTLLKDINTTLQHIHRDVEEQVRPWRTWAVIYGRHMLLTTLGQYCSVGAW